MQSHGSALYFAMFISRAMLPFVQYHYIRYWTNGGRYQRNFGICYRSRS